MKEEKIKWKYIVYDEYAILTRTEADVCGLFKERQEFIASLKNPRFEVFPEERVMRLKIGEIDETVLTAGEAAEAMVLLLNKEKQTGYMNRKLFWECIENAKASAEKNYFLKDGKLFRIPVDSEGAGMTEFVPDSFGWKPVEADLEKMTVLSNEEAAEIIPVLLGKN